MDLFGQVSPDGRFITYVDWGGDQNLMVHDLVTNTDWPLTATGPSVGFSQYAEFSTISRDGTQVVYAWFNDKGLVRSSNRSSARDHAATASGVFPGQSRLPRHRSGRDWSPDGKLIAVRIRRRMRLVRLG